MSNKMEIIIMFKDENGNDEIKPVIVEVDVPSYEEFLKFREGFELYSLLRIEEKTWS